MKHSEKYSTQQFAPISQLLEVFRKPLFSFRGSESETDHNWLTKFLWSPQCYRQWVYRAPLCITLKLKIWVVAYLKFIIFFQVSKFFFFKLYLFSSQGFPFFFSSFSTLFSKGTTFRYSVATSQRLWPQCSPSCSFCYGRRMKYDPFFFVCALSRAPFLTTSSS